jgi:hypothetical protein
MLNENTDLHAIMTKKLVSVRNGSPYDRGNADCYYGKEYNPHFYLGDTKKGFLITFGEMTAAEIVEYSNGYRDCKIANFKK